MYELKNRVSKLRVDVDHHEKAQALLIENGESFYRVDDKGNKDKL